MMYILIYNQNIKYITFSIVCAARYIFKIFNILLNILKIYIYQIVYSPTYPL